MQIFILYFFIFLSSLPVDKNKKKYYITTLNERKTNF
jgi:hypothetical protein